jgi:hypothetical protein
MAYGEYAASSSEITPGIVSNDEILLDMTDCYKCLRYAVFAKADMLL